MLRTKYLYDFFKIVTKPEILENIRITLACQLAHRSSLIVAINLTDTCLQWTISLPSTENMDKVSNITNLQYFHRSITVTS